jgi:NADH-quinone oxidoreductase subunit E
MMEITNGVYVHNLTPDKIDDLVESLRAGEVPSFTSMTLPQDEEELDGNRRTRRRTRRSPGRSTRSKT